MRPEEESEPLGARTFLNTVKYEQKLALFRIFRSVGDLSRTSCPTEKPFQTLRKLDNLHVSLIKRPADSGGSDDDR